jgi:DNA-binding transcriptional regulator LsrR (DeoR family)
MPDAAPSATERGVTWRFAWAAPTTEERTAARIWLRLIRGDGADAVAQELGMTESDLERHLQSLVLHEQVRVEKVMRDAGWEERVQACFSRQPRRPRLRDVRVANLSHVESRLMRHTLLGYVAKEYFLEQVHTGDSVGFCGGFTISRLIYALRREEWPAGIRVQPVAVSPILERAAVSANNLVGALAYRAYDRAIQATQLPFYPDSERHPPTASITEMMLADARNLDFLFIGAGAPGQGALELDIDLKRQEYLWMAGIEPNTILQHKTSAGNLMYYLVNETGEQPADFKTPNEMMVCSIGLDGLRHLVDRGKRVVIVAAGDHKARIVRAAVTAGYVNVLLIDDGLAQALVETASAAR